MQTKTYSLVFMLFLITSSAAWSDENSLAQLKSQIKEHKGQVIYVDFWASWCKPCKKSFPWMNKMLSKYEDKGLKIITVNLDKEKNLADEFLAENPATFDIIFDPSGTIASEFKLKGMPMSFIIGRDGKTQSAHVGFNETKQVEYENEIIELLNQGSQSDD